MIFAQFCIGESSTSTVQSARKGSHFLCGPHLMRFFRNLSEVLRVHKKCETAVHFQKMCAKLKENVWKSGHMCCAFVQEMFVANVC